MRSRLASSLRIVQYLAVWTWRSKPIMHIGHGATASCTVQARCAVVLCFNGSHQILINCLIVHITVQQLVSWLVGWLVEVW